MSSYHSSFKFLDKKSDEDFGWMIVHFEVDEGESDSYLSQEQVYTDSHNGSRRLLYGTKWDEVATVKITVMKQNQSDFTEIECRNAYKWLTGNPNASYLDLYLGDTIRYSFLGTVQNVKPQKLDARTIGLNIYFESVSPWAYSAVQTFGRSFGQLLSVDSNGTLMKGDMYDTSLNITKAGALYNSTRGNQSAFQFAPDGTVFLDNSTSMQIDNQSDDLYSFVILNTVLNNVDSDYISIRNKTLNEETIISNMSVNENIILSSGQFIISDIPNKIFGKNFNYVWPKLAPGINEIVIDGTGALNVIFTYRYPIKIGDCAIDIGNFEQQCACDSSTSDGHIHWNNIIDTPNTIAGYGINDAYTMQDIDDKFANVGTGSGTTVDKDALYQMLDDILR